MFPCNSAFEQSNLELRRYKNTFIILKLLRQHGWTKIALTIVSHDGDIQEMIC